jgi:hypothetical protein
MKFPWYIWIPRGLMMAVMAFAMLFSFDSFEAKYTIWQQLTGFFMHNIPVWVLLAVLLLTWKRPLWGGILLLVVAAFLTFFFAYGFRKYFLFDFLAFVLPLIIAAGLFILAHYKRIKT